MPNQEKVKHSFPKRAAWLLILNDSHQEKRFTSLKLLRQYADENHLFIKKSQTQEKCYYTDPYAYVPGNR